MSCAEHVAYLAAVADGETQLVPASTLEHIRVCRGCQAEVQTHQLVTGRLREAAAAGSPQPGRTRVASSIPSRRLWAAATAAALVVAAAVSAFFAVQSLTGSDQVLAAAAAAQRPAQFRSVDEYAIGTWCERQSGRLMPVVALPQLAPTGARLDWLGRTEVVTLDYATDAGARVTVSWLDTNAVGPTGRRIEMRSVGGRTVLLVRSPSGSAVIAGDAPVAILWSTAAQLQEPRSP